MINTPFPRFAAALALSVLFIPFANAGSISVSVSQDTYLRNDGGTPANGNNDADNEVLAGRTDRLRPLLGFDVSQITNDVTNIGGGDFAKLTITSATLTLYERRGGLIGGTQAGTLNINSYDFSFVDSASTWSAPAAGDLTAGGTVGTMLASGHSIGTWDSTADNDSSVITLSGANLSTALQNSATLGSLNLLITSSGYGANVFHSITSDRSAATSRHARLDIEYTVQDVGPQNPLFQLATSSPASDFTFPPFEAGPSPQKTVRYEVVATDGATVTIDALAVTNDPSHPSAAFAVTSIPAVPVTLSGGESIDITVTAVGSTPGSFSGSLFIDTTSANGAVPADRWDTTLPLSSTVTGANSLANGGFEGAPFDSGWNASGVASATGLEGTATAAQLPFNSSATLGQVFSSQTDFTVDFSVSVAGASTTDSFHVYLDTAGGNAVELRGGIANILQINNGGSYTPLTRISNGATFGFGADLEVKIRLIGRSFGSSGAQYDVAWSEPGGTALVHAATGLTAFATPAATSTGGITGIRFDRANTTGHSYTIDNVFLSGSAELAPSADYQLVSPLPPTSDKVVAISGVYPHLTMTNEHLECGPGAIVPWAGDLWVVTYAPSAFSGSTDKLYQIEPDLSRVIRPESVGGTPANRMIHNESNQLFIGPHAIAADGTVRTIPVSTMPGRMTGTARHLTDPANKIYHATMEEGFYEVDVNTLAVNTLFVDGTFSGSPKANLPGAHGKGLYTSQGKLYYTNNGNGGTLSAWDGANWSSVQNTKFTEVTGPGGIRGNDPADDRLWTVGWDGRSLILKVLEAGVWTDFRLPKSSYTHDAEPGWFTEWPRIRQLDPDTPGSPYLMHMHGMFFDFPKTFSAANFSGLQPLCSYHKMPVDYCTFEGRLVMTKNDLSKFANSLAPRAQSNLWFGQLEDLSEWGAPQGHGGVWVNESVAAGQISDPFLVNGFSRITLHLRNGGGAVAPVEIESSNGDGTWTPVTTLNVPANGYTYEILNDLSVEWLRLKNTATASNLTAYFLLSNPYPHASIASQGSDRFAALADIRDTGGHSDGIIRPMAGTDLQLEFASNGGGYHRIGGQIELDDVANGTAESSLRSQGALTQQFGSDAASAWIDASGTRLRLPKLDALYDAPFASGWARGFREVVTERELLNCHGTFYEIPRDNSGGKRRMRPLATHGKRITDFTSWRGLLVLSGVLDDAPASDSLVRSPSGAALWLGEVDDIWKMGEPRGTGGPWKNTAVTAGQPSDPYLMYGYDRKEMTLTTTDAATLTVEVDFLANDTWFTYQTFSLAAGESLTHVFPAGFHAHWVRVTSDAATTATAQFAYGPADQRDTFLDWGRAQGLPTGSGRSSLASRDEDGDRIPELFEFLFGTDPRTPAPSPISVNASGMSVILRNLAPEDGVSVTFESSIDLKDWAPRSDLAAADPDQFGVQAGFTRWIFNFDSETEPRRFVRLNASIR